MKYYSEKLNLLYDSAEELQNAEDKATAEEQKKLALKSQREERAKAVGQALQESNAAQKKANDLLRDFVKDYGSFHTSLREPFECIFDAFSNFFK